MDESKPGPLDGILEEEPAKAQVTSPNAKESGGDSNGRVTNIRPGAGSIPDGELRKLREAAVADVATIANQMKVMNAMILALRGAVGGAAVAAIIALLQTRKLQKRVAALEEGKSGRKPLEGRTVEVEATASPAKTVEPVQVGD